MFAHRFKVASCKLANSLSSNGVIEYLANAGFQMH